MKMPPMPFAVTSWSGVPPTVRLDETGQATWRTFTIGDLRVCLVEYTAGYRADHWWGGAGVEERRAMRASGHRNRG